MYEFKGDYQKHARGTIWWYREDKNIIRQDGILSGSRPVLIVSNNKYNFFSSVVSVIPITSTIKESIPSHVSILLDKKSELNVEQLRSVPKDSLVEFIGIAEKHIMDVVDDTMVQQFAITSNLDKGLSEKIKQLEMVISTLKKDALRHNEVLERMNNEIEEAVNKIVERKSNVVTKIDPSDKNLKRKNTKHTEEKKLESFEHWTDTAYIKKLFNYTTINSVYTYKNKIKKEYEAWLANKNKVPNK